MTDTQDLVQELRKLGSIREDAPLKCRVKIQEAADRIEELEAQLEVETRSAKYWKEDALRIEYNRLDLEAKLAAANERAEKAECIINDAKSQAKEILATLISGISEERYAAGWHTGISRELWSEQKRADLLAMRKISGGWWITCDWFLEGTDKEILAALTGGNDGK